MLCSTLLVKFSTTLFYLLNLKKLVSPIPPRELGKAKYDIHYCNEKLKKKHSINITVVEAQLHMNEQY
jgi:hypothetical protein